MTKNEMFEIGKAINYIAMILPDNEFKKIEDKLKIIVDIVEKQRIEE